MLFLDVHLLSACLAGAAVSGLVAGLVRHVALSRGIVVAPRPDRWHRQPTPTYGGIGILCGLLAGAGVAGGLAPDAWPVIATSLTLFVIGLFDDLMPMSALAKMVASLAVAAFFVLGMLALSGAGPVHAALI